MNRRTPHRIFTTLMVVVSLLFAQLALAQFVCPVAQPEEAMAMPCDGMGHEQEPQPQPALCFHHCTNAAQSFEPMKLPVLSLPAVVQVIFMPLRIDAAVEEAVAFALAGEAQPPPSSPVFLSTQRLRV